MNCTVLYTEVILIQEGFAKPCLILAWYGLYTGIITKIDILSKISPLSGERYSPYISRQIVVNISPEWAIPLY